MVKLFLVNVLKWIQGRGGTGGREMRMTREWRLAIVFSFMLHLALLGVLVWRSGGVEENVPIVVEFSPRSKVVATTVASAGGVLSSSRSNTLVKYKDKQGAPKKNGQEKATREAEVTLERRDLNLVSNRSFSRKLSQETVQARGKESASTVAGREGSRELTLEGGSRRSRSERYIGTEASTGRAVPSLGKSGGGSKNLLGGSTVKSLGPGAASPEGGGAGENPTGGRSSTSQTSLGDGRASFDWGGEGRQERKLLASYERELPESVRGGGITAQTRINFKVDREGRPYGVEIVKTSGYYELDEWTARYVRTFRFNRVSDRLTYQAKYTQYFRP